MAAVDSHKKGDAEGAVRKLMNLAIKSWTKRQDMVDDVSCVVIQLNVPERYESTATNSL